MSGKRSAWKELKHLFDGSDGKLSIRRVLGTIAFSTFIYVVIYSVVACKNVQEGILWALVAVIGGFFTMTTLQNIANDKSNKLNGDGEH